MDERGGMKLEQTILSLKAIENEIELTTDTIKRFETQLEELKEKYKRLTERLGVLQALEAKLPEGMAKLVIKETIKIVINERFELAPGLSNKKSNIEHQTNILVALQELKNEVG